MNFVLILLLTISPINSELMDYVRNVGSYFNFGQKDKTDISDSEFVQRIPYEVSLVDEKFIQEAAKLTGVILSELDSCQQRVVLKLKSDCHKLNDEALSKMAVHLLNCQSFVEGRKIYPCTDEMSIKDCTSEMDSDTWTSYHLMTNRARAVCYSIRQNQFRGLAEHTVNRLMEAAQDQLTTLGKIEHNQEQIREVAETTYESLSKGHEALKQQQQDLQKAQLHEMLTLEDNIQRLISEKKVIAETHNYLIGLTQEVQKSLQDSSRQLEHQAGENKEHHSKLIQDITSIHKKAQQIFSKIEDSSRLLVQQREELITQYASTLKNLNEVNKTVHTLVQLVGGTRQALEERINWLTAALGGTDLALERLYHIISHSLFMLLAMIACAFSSAQTSTRLMVVMGPALNLALALIGHNSLELTYLGLGIVLCIAVQALINYLLVKTEIRGALPWIKQKLTPTKTVNTNKTETPNLNETYTETYNNYRYQQNGYTSQSFNNNYEHEEEEAGAYEKEESKNSFDDFITSPTPPLSRIGSRSRSNTPSSIGRTLCTALTRTGASCKLRTMHGRDVCYRHQKGSSIIIS